MSHFLYKCTLYLVVKLVLTIAVQRNGLCKAARWGEWEIFKRPPLCFSSPSILADDKMYKCEKQSKLNMFSYNWYPYHNIVTMHVCCQYEVLSAIILNFRSMFYVSDLKPVGNVWFFNHLLYCENIMGQMTPLLKLCICFSINLKGVMMTCLAGQSYT